MGNRKFHRAVSWVCLVALLFSLVGAVIPTIAFAAEDTITIRTAEDFEKFARNCTLDTWSQGKMVVLSTDISLEGMPGITVPIFSGNFDGKGHTISGVSIQKGMAPAGLFCVLASSGTIQNLKVSGTVAPSGNIENTGGIVGRNYGKITGCTFTGTVRGKLYTGGIVGTNEVSGIVSTSTASGSVVGDNMTGGIAGCNLGILNGCTNNAYVNTEVIDPAPNPTEVTIELTGDVTRLSTVDTSLMASDTGGVAGYSSGTLSGCKNKAPVGYPHTGYNVGGIVGRSSGYIHSCENTGSISGRKDIGGIAGQMEPYISRTIMEDPQK